MSNKKDIKDISSSVALDIDGWSLLIESSYHPGQCQERVRGIMESQERAGVMAETARRVMSGEPLTTPVCRVGVAVWIRNEDGHILMGKRKGSHGAGTWSLPGGHVDFGEHPRETVRRELMEECGIEVGNICRTPQFSYQHKFFPDDNKQYITLFFDAEYLPLHSKPRNMEPDKCEGWKWFPWDALPSPLFGALDDELMIEAMRKANA